jgi:peptidoglycan/LPS O-acetylase OafA/YrhL
VAAPDPLRTPEPGHQQPEPSPATEHSYRHEIDGLRALAVLAVIVFHLKASALPGGFWGVDVFFVISGFLITSIILRDLRAGVFSLRAFWLRRVRRLLPALLVSPQRAWLPLDATAALFSFSNILIHHRVGNYWGELAETLPLLHTWSLSVEEQFYRQLPLDRVTLPAPRIPLVPAPDARLPRRRRRCPGHPRL